MSIEMKGDDLFELNPIVKDFINDGEKAIASLQERIAKASRGLIVVTEVIALKEQLNKMMYYVHTVKELNAQAVNVVRDGAKNAMSAGNEEAARQLNAIADEIENPPLGYIGRNDKGRPLAGAEQEYRQ